LCCKTNCRGDVGITIAGRELLTAWPQSYGAPRREGRGSCRKPCRDQDPAPAGSGPLGAARFRGQREEEEETYFALLRFKEIKVHSGTEPLHSTGCGTSVFTEDLKDPHPEKPTLLGSVPRQSSQ